MTKATEDTRKRQKPRRLTLANIEAMDVPDSVALGEHQEEEGEEARPQEDSKTSPQSFCSHKKKLKERLEEKADLLYKLMQEEKSLQLKKMHLMAELETMQLKKTHLKREIETIDTDLKDLQSLEAFLKNL